MNPKYDTHTVIASAYDEQYAPVQNLYRERINSYDAHTDFANDERDFYDDDYSELEYELYDRDRARMDTWTMLNCR